MTENEDGNDYQNPITSKKNNVLPLWGNERSMNLNPLILTNIQSSHYFKVNLYELKTYHEVIDEIYYKVQHLEPWEKGSRKTSGQTGMCGGVRGVGAGGIVSTAYCLLYKLFTLKMTRKQLNGLINHTDSPYIRAIGFMYIRYTQPPADLWDWYDAYLEDEEELDVKAGGGQTMTIGNILRSFLVKLEWFSTLFPRIPVPIQQKIEKQMNERFPVQYSASNNYRLKPNTQNNDVRHIPDNEAHYGEAERHARYSKDSGGYSQDKDRYKSNYDKYSSNRYASPDHKKHRYDSPDRKKSKYDSPERKKSKYDSESSSSRDKYDSRDRYDKDRYSSSDKDRYRDKYSSRDRHERDRDSRPSSKYHDDRTYRRY